METTMSRRNTFDLIKGDCLDVMESIPDGSIDMVMCDPPYGTTQNRWDSVIPLDPMWRHLKRLVKLNGAILICSRDPFTSFLITSNPKLFRYKWVWDKAISTGFLNAKKQPLRQTEDVCAFYREQCAYIPTMEVRGRPRVKGGHVKPGGSDNYGDYRSIKNVNNEYYPTDILRISNARRSGKLHPTQKPVALMEYMIKTYSHPGETVLDFVMGSGTTGVACANLGRSFIGIELDDTYFEIAKSRVNAARMQFALG